MSKESPKKSETQVPPSVAAMQEGKVIAQDDNISVHALNTNGTFIGFLEMPNGARIPATCYVKNGKVEMLSTPYDNEESKGRPQAFVIYDLGILFQRVLREGQIL